MTITKLRIFDFDETISIYHTFQQTRLRDWPPITADKIDEIYEKGRKAAEHNAKSQIPFKHDNETVSAIATFHNNPHYIAGFISHILQKKLTLSRTWDYKDGTAINEYIIEGSSKPFLICYIHILDNSYTDFLHKVGNKNLQIGHLRTAYQSKMILADEHTVDFYDDSKDNCSGANLYRGVTSHQVTTGDPVFIATPFITRQEPVKLNSTQQATQTVPLPTASNFESGANLYRGVTSHQGTTGDPVFTATPFITRQEPVKLNSTQQTTQTISLPTASNFENEKKKIQELFLAELEGLSRALGENIKKGKDFKPIVDLISALKKEQKDLFEQLTINSKPETIKKALETFQTNCLKHSTQADAVLGHGRLFKIVEAVVKAIGALVVGLGMAIASVAGQGFANKSHRDIYKDTFFTAHKTTASQYIDLFNNVSIPTVSKNIDELSPKYNPR